LRHCSVNHAYPKRARAPQDDAHEAALGLPAGEFDLGLAIQDRQILADGSMVYPSSWQLHVFGTMMLVNGVVTPYMNVKRAKYRLRLLNGCNARFLDLSLVVLGGSNNTLPLSLVRNRSAAGQQTGQERLMCAWARSRRRAALLTPR
jgi:hypothetical protein